MSIDLKDYIKTQYIGLYKSKISYGDIGKKLIGRFQLQGKKYVKVLGYSKQDGLNEDKAYKKLLEYKYEIKSNNHEITEYIDIKKNIFPYYNLIKDKILIRKAIKRVYEKEKIKPYQIELIKLQNFLESTKKKMIILFEGRDASGKGGIIRRITRYMNSKHYRIIALGKPNQVQKNQWYYQRYIEYFPTSGEIVLFDRSWYNRAIVEPIFGFCSNREYKNFMEDVNTFERSLVKDDIILIKLYFSVSKEIQKNRFSQREDNPLKNWKLSEIDLQAQGLWDNFSEKKVSMLKKTSTQTEPWIVIKSDDKAVATMESMKIILNSIKYSDQNKNLDYSPDSKIVFTSKEELRNMKEDLY